MCLIVATIPSHWVRRHARYNIPITLGKGKSSTYSDVPVSDSITIKTGCDLTIPGQTVQLITGRIEPPHTHTYIDNVLVEPLEGTSIPAHVCTAHSISALYNNYVVLQVMNVGSTSVTLYKGMCLTTATPKKEILTITQDQAIMLGTMLLGRALCEDKDQLCFQHVV